MVKFAIGMESKKDRQNICTYLHNSYRRIQSKSRKRAQNDFKIIQNKRQKYSVYRYQKYKFKKKSKTNVNLLIRTYF